MKTMEEIRSQLPSFTVNDYFRHLKTIETQIDPSGLKPLRVAVLRSYTMEMIEPILKFKLLLEGYNPEFFFGGYNQFAQEILDTSGSLYRFNPHVIIVMSRLEELLPDFVHSFATRPFSEWEKNTQAAVQQFGSYADTINNNATAQVIFQNMALPADPCLGIYDVQQPEGQTYLVHEFNRMLAEEFKGRQNTFIWDYGRFLQMKGYETICDPKMWYLSKNPFKQSAYLLIADDLLKYLLSIMGRMKKCVVLDLDNTLWGGIAGEDGIEGVALGHDYPGNCYRDFQKGLLKLYHRGIILAINSKNNEQDALEIIYNHPYMVLRKEHFASMQINWNDKATNLRAIAEYLNIGIDSMIFIDDSPIECELVRRQYPECAVVCLPEKTYLVPDVLNDLPGIENIRLTEEDRTKGKKYREQAARKEYEKTISNLDEFLKGLDIEVVIEPATDFSVPRIAQLTQKTNQMNMTTRRYTESDIQTFSGDGRSSVFCVSSRDRFGDHGIVGVLIVMIGNDECVIDTFLLSCRVIGRNIEQSMLAFIADFAREKGLRALVGEYLPTAKNLPAADIYARYGFEKRNDTLFTVDLRSQKLEYPPYIKHTTSLPQTKQS